jgi:hypothetical protein
MMQEGALIADYGPGFLGQAVKVDNGIVCVIPCEWGRVEVRATMRDLVQGLGGKCGGCQGCPLGKAG